MDKNQLRKEKSEIRLREAMIELIHEIGFERITIIDLCKKAGVNRGTFYLHYPDKYALYDQMKAERIHELKQLINTIQPQAMVEHIEQVKASEQVRPHPIQLQICQFFYEHAAFFRVIMGPNGDQKYMQQLRATIIDLMTLRVHEFGEGVKQFPVPNSYLVTYLISANIGMIQRWMEDGCPFPPEQVATAIMRLTQHVLSSFRA